VATEKNSEKLWDNVWDYKPNKEKDIYQLYSEENSIQWKKIESKIISNFGSFNNLSIIEIGAGSGTNAALMAKRGAKVTILDYSIKAIERSKIFFKNNDLDAEYIIQDALNIPLDFVEKFDIAMSFGLTEHFLDDQRERINDTHFKLIRKGGIIFISVPNKYCIPYQISKKYLESTGNWNVGEEYPYSRRELHEISKRNGITEYSIFGDSFYSSFNMIIPRQLFQKFFKVKSKSDLLKIRKEYPSLLDDYFSYALILYGKK
jgi:2-polyprenyl-3-methyl-5-hydroxy-6-metoxy-1,4-benzoquinol methylase